MNTPARIAHSFGEALRELVIEMTRVLRHPSWVLVLLIFASAILVVQVVR